MQTFCTVSPSRARTKWTRFIAGRFARSYCLEGITLSLEGMSRPLKRAIINGRYEKAEVALCRQMVCEGDRILELGGAIGFVGLYCLHRRKAATVVSVEANPATAVRLEENYKRNNLVPRVVVAAVSDEDGTTKLNVGVDFWEDSLSSRPESLRQIEVRAISLPSLLSQREESFNCLLIDIEGAESRIDWKVIPSSIEKVIIELHPEFIGFPTSYRILFDLHQAGFEVHGTSGSVFGLIRTPKNQRTEENDQKQPAALAPC